MKITPPRKADAMPPAADLNLATVPDPGAEELLEPASPAAPSETSPPSDTSPTPPATEPSTPPSAMPHSETLSEEQLYPDQPADLPDPHKVVPLDPAAAQTAWEELLAFIHQHKDPGTEIDIPDTLNAVATNELS